jgi:O-antigen biosynthesis protein
MDSVYQTNVDPLRANNSHSIALQLIGRNKRVLEVGAAGGHVTKAIKDQDNYVVAVERDGRLAEGLHKVADQVIITDLDWIDLREKCGEKQYDVILAGDVLEHCVHPDLVLLQFHHLLSDEGYIVLSIPNIAHGDVRLSLLQGHFQYRETGLLDQTHIRFFTRDTLNAFLQKNGFEIVEIFGTTAELGTTEFGPVPIEVPGAAVDFVRQDRDSNIYQFVLKAQRSDDFKISNSESQYSQSENTNTDLLLAQISEYQSLASSRGFLLKELETTRQELETTRQELHHLHLRLGDTQIKLQQEIVVTSHQIKDNLDLSLQLLEAKDSIIGLTARIEELKHRLNRQRENHQKHLVDIYSSTTWKIGKALTFPIRLVKKVLRRS